MVSSSAATCGLLGPDPLALGAGVLPGGGGGELGSDQTEGHGDGRNGDHQRTSTHELFSSPRSGVGGATRVVMKP